MFKKLLVVCGIISFVLADTNTTDDIPGFVDFNISNEVIADTINKAVDDLTGMDVNDTECQEKVISFHKLFPTVKDTALEQEYKNCIEKKAVERKHEAERSIRIEENKKFEAQRKQWYEERSDVSNLVPKAPDMVSANMTDEEKIVPKI